LMWMAGSKKKLKGWRNYTTSFLIIHELHKLYKLEVRDYKDRSLPALNRNYRSMKTSFRKVCKRPLRTPIWNFTTNIQFDIIVVKVSTAFNWLVSSNSVKYFYNTHEMQIITIKKCFHFAV
jgi:hypothetical protein